MARFHSHSHSHSLLFLIIVIVIITLSSSIVFVSCSTHDFDPNLFHQDYSPPAPPPPPPHAPSVSCTDDLGGIGSLDSTCQIPSDLNLTGDVYIAGKGNFIILPNVKFQCPIPGCSITLNITGNFTLGTNSSIYTGTLELSAYNATLFNNSAVNTTGLGGTPPPQTSGTPSGIEGAGGGHGGRGACCLLDERKLPEDVWGGDAYSWSSLQTPWSYGSKGGSTSKEVDYGGSGGGRVKMEIVGLLEVDACVLADGADAGNEGGGGSAGSIHIKAYKM